ncbi:MAG: hypothetical protein SFY80_15010 [Verrucomicrobiota bacterium]|nr:hypothetical protein [Verrucomicrobiota bacterium]
MEIALGSLLPAFKRFQLIYVALRIGLIARLGAGPATSDDLATSLGITETRLVRLLRGLVWAQVLEMDDTGRYRLTDEARILVDDSPTSLAGGILFRVGFSITRGGTCSIIYVMVLFHSRKLTAPPSSNLLGLTHP